MIIKQHIDHSITGISNGFAFYNGGKFIKLHDNDLKKQSSKSTYSCMSVLLTGRSVVRSFGRSVVRSFGRSFGRSVVRSFGRSVVQSFGRSVRPSRLSLVSFGPSV